MGFKRKLSCLSAIMLIILQFGVISSVMAASSVYYVDAVYGDDNNDGLSAEKAWKTVDKVKNTVNAAGDTILFRRGQKWYDASFAPSCNSMTYGAYGEGDAPILSGAVPVDGWKVYSGTIYTAPAPVAESPYLIKYGDRLFRYSKPESVEDVKEGYFCYAGGMLYINSNEAITGTAEVQKSHTIFHIDQKKYITIKDLALTMSGGSCVAINSGKSMYNTVDNCEMYYAESAYGEGSGIQCSSSKYGKFTNNNIHDIFGDGIMLWNSDGNLVDSNTVRGLMTGVNTDGDGIQCAGKSGNAAPDNVITNNFVSMEGSNSPKGCIQQENGDNVYIAGNTCLYGYFGIESNSNNGVVENNLCAYQGLMKNKVNWSAGLYISEEEDVLNMTWRNNIVYASYPLGFRIGSPEGHVRTGFEIYNNTICSTGTPLAILCSFDGMIKNNILYNASGGKTVMNLTDIIEGGSAVSDSNVLYPHGEAFLKWDGNTYNDIWTLRSVTGQEQNSRISAPLFSNVTYGQSELPIRDDFRLFSNSPGVGDGAQITDAEGNVIYSSGCQIGAMQETVENDAPSVDDPTQPDIMEKPLYKKGLLAYEGFDYKATEALEGKNGGEGFSSAWTQTVTGTLTGKTGTDTLSYDGVYTTGYSALIASTYRRDFKNAVFTDNGTYYVSYLINNKAGRGSTFTLGDSSGGKININWESKSGWRLKTNTTTKYKEAGQSASSAMVLLKVVQNDTKTSVSLWINPDLSNGLTGIGTAHISDTATQRITPEYISFSISTGASAFTALDEIRIASDFDAVISQTSIKPKSFTAGEISVSGGGIEFGESVLFNQLGKEVIINVPVYNTPQKDKTAFIATVLKCDNAIKACSASEVGVSADGTVDAQIKLDTSELENDSYTMYVYVWDKEGFVPIRKYHTLYVVKNN